MRAPVWLLIVGSAFVLAPRASAQASDGRFHAERVRQFYLAEVDDAIARANQLDFADHLPPPHRDLPWSGSAQLSIVFLRFFGNIAPNSTGIERPAPDDHPVDDYEIDLGSHLSTVILGAANNHLLTALHSFQQYDGMLALRYDIVPHDQGSPVRVAVAASPLYGSLTTIARHGGVQEDEQLPTSVVLGGAAGVDSWYDGRVFGIHARVWAMPGVDVVNGGRTGMSTLESIQIKWHSTETLHGDPSWPVDVGLLAFHLDRGDARAAVYDWAGDFRSAIELRDLWQITAFVELRVN